MAEPKKGRGGARKGAGRKKTTPPIAKPASKSVAAAVLDHVGEFERWVRVIEATSPDSLDLYASVTADGTIRPVSARDAAAIIQVHANSLRFLHEQVNGKAKQAIDLTGEVVFETLAERLARARNRECNQPK